MAGKEGSHYLSSTGSSYYGASSNANQQIPRTGSGSSLHAPGPDLDPSPATITPPPEPHATPDNSDSVKSSNISLPLKDSQSISSNDLNSRCRDVVNTNENKLIHNNATDRAKLSLKISQNNITNDAIAQLANDIGSQLQTGASPSVVLNALSRGVRGSVDAKQGQMVKFLSGFRRFHKNYFEDNQDLYAKLRLAQAPKTLFIGCSDSRADPAIITDCDPGDLFVVRNVANLVAPYESDAGLHGVSAALEFAVKYLNVENIIVMGHTKCGGISALMKGGEYGEFIGPWVRIAQKAKDKVLNNFSDQPAEVQLRACEHASILLSLENLVTYPFVRERLMSGRLTLAGWYFDFEHGNLLGYSPENHRFEPLAHGDWEHTNHTGEPEIGAWMGECRNASDISQSQKESIGPDGQSSPKKHRESTLRNNTSRLNLFPVSPETKILFQDDY